MKLIIEIPKDDYEFTKGAETARFFPSEYYIKLILNGETLDSVLDKIRAEIDEQYDRVHPYDISCAEGLEMALEIIDKYKAESEE